MFMYVFLAVYVAVSAVMLSRALRGLLRPKR